MEPPPVIQPSRFFNRVAELDALQRAYSTPSPNGQLVLVSGRRRLGKTFLLQRFFAGAPGENPKPHCYHLADQSNATEQRESIARQLLETFPEPGTEPAEIAVSWNSLLRHVGRLARPDGPRIGWILDEFPYLVEQTPELPSILQAWWDREGIHKRLMVVLCGSHLSTMNSLGTPNAPLYGRFSGGMLPIRPLGYRDVAEFTRNLPGYDIPWVLSLYGMLGGTPRYHALLDPTKDPQTAVCDLLLRPGAPLENEVSFLLGSEQIRDPAPLHTVLSAIARGETRYNNIQNALGGSTTRLSYPLSTLLELGWVRRELPFEETSDRRALYRTADPFLDFWYRCIRPVRSALAFQDPMAVFRNRILPVLPDHMGRHVFESICLQWLQNNATTRLGLAIEDAGRWWSRDGKLEFDVLARVYDGSYLFGECKWSVGSRTGTDDWMHLVGKIGRHPEAKWRDRPRTALFALEGFTPELERAAADPANRLTLIGPDELLD